MLVAKNNIQKWSFLLASPIFFLYDLHYLNNGTTHLATGFIQLYGDNKAWIPHPILTFDIDNKREAVTSFLQQNKKDEAWINKNGYLYTEKNKRTLQSNLYLKKAIFISSTFRYIK